MAWHGTAVWWGIIRCGSFFFGKMHQQHLFVCKQHLFCFRISEVSSPLTHTTYQQFTRVAVLQHYHLSLWYLVCLRRKEEEASFSRLPGTRTVADINPGSESGLSVRTTGGAIVFNTTPRRVRVYSKSFLLYYIFYVIMYYIYFL